MAEVGKQRQHLSQAIIFGLHGVTSYFYNFIGWVNGHSLGKLILVAAFFTLFIYLACYQTVQEHE